MKCLLLVIAAAATGALALLSLGCTTETTVLPSEREAPGITVAGSGEASGEPDVAVLSLGVEARADSVGAAREQAANSMNAMLDALKQGGVEEKDIQTARFNVQPVYDFSNNRQELIAFTVSNIVTAKIRSIDDTGDLIDAAVVAGGDLARVENLTFTIDDPSALEQEARVAAMEEARSKAETLAQAGGIELGEPISISEAGGAVPVAFDRDQFAAAQEAGALTPIQVGELDVTVTVQVVYAVE